MILIASLSFLDVNKLKTLVGVPINFGKYIDYQTIRKDEKTVQRVSYLQNPEKKIVQPEKSTHYTHLDRYFNR